MDNYTTEKISDQTDPVIVLAKKMCAQALEYGAKHHKEEGIDHLALSITATMLASIMIMDAMGKFLVDDEEGKGEGLRLFQKMAMNNWNDNMTEYGLELRVREHH